MKIKYPHPIVQPVLYIADDGTEFTNRRSCETYECELAIRTIDYHLESRYVDTVDDTPAYLWYIHNRDEFEWLKKTEWVHTDILENFRFDKWQEGWYIAIFHDGGDSRDWYEVYLAKDYIDAYQAKIDEIKELTSL